MKTNYCLLTFNKLITGYPKRMIICKDKHNFNVSEKYSLPGTQSQGQDVTSGFSATYPGKYLRCV